MRMELLSIEPSEKDRHLFDLMQKLDAIRKEKVGPVTLPAGLQGMCAQSESTEHYARVQGEMFEQQLDRLRRYVCRSL
jgi:hypothetical protein